VRAGTPWPMWAKKSLRSGVVLDGGVSRVDRPRVMRVLTPSRAMARQIEWRIDNRFQSIDDIRKVNANTGNGVAFAQAEGIVNVYVPRTFPGDWEHFGKLVSHL